MAQIIFFALGGGASVNSLCSERLREQRSSGLFTANLTTACERIVHTSTLNTSTLAIGRELRAGRGWWWRSGDSGGRLPVCLSAAQQNAAIESAPLESHSNPAAM